MNVRSLNNIGGGCMGMCQETFGYRMAAQKMVPGTNNFATVWTSEEMKRTADASFKETTISLSQLCNADKSAQIRFAPISMEDQQPFNAFDTSISQIEGGSTSLQGTNNAQISLNNA